MGEDLSDSVESDVCKLIDEESPSSFEVRLFRVRPHFLSPQRSVHLPSGARLSKD